jgi:ATPase involved in DNA repair
LNPPIQRIEIQNFQSHRNTVLEPGPGGQLTVVTGPSDSGKTAILRALRWLLYNVPQGTDFIRVGCTFAKVIVTLADGTEVERFRTPSKNQYAIRHPGAEPQVYEGFGSTVPLEVQETLGVRPITIGDLELP